MGFARRSPSCLFPVSLFPSVPTYLGTVTRSTIRQCRLSRGACMLPSSYPSPLAPRTPNARQRCRERRSQGRCRNLDLAVGHCNDSSSMFSKPQMLPSNQGTSSTSLSDNARESTLMRSAHPGLSTKCYPNQEGIDGRPVNGMPPPPVCLTCHIIWPGRFSSALARLKSKGFMTCGRLASVVSALGVDDDLNQKKKCCPVCGSCHARGPSISSRHPQASQLHSTPPRYCN